MTPFYRTLVVAVLLALVSACGTDSDDNSAGSVDAGFDARDSAGEADVAAPSDAGRDAARTKCVDQNQSDCGALAACSWVESVGCFDAAPAGGQPLPEGDSLDGSFVGFAQRDAAPDEPRQATLSFFDHVGDLRGYFSMRATAEPDAPRLEMQVRGQLSDDRRVVALRLDGLTCSGDEEACRPWREAPPSYLAHGYHDQGSVHFGPAQQLDGSGQSLFDDMRMQPHDGFKPTHVPSGQRVGAWLEDGLTDWRGWLHTGTDLTSGTVAPAACSFGVEVDTDSVSARSMVCDGQDWASAPSPRLIFESFSYDPTTNRFWFLVESNSQRWTLVGDYRSSHLVGLVAAPTVWRADAAPVDPLTLDPGDIAGVFRFDSESDGAR